MAVNKKITELTLYTGAPAVDDSFPFVDKSDATDAASGTSKRFEWEELIKQIAVARINAQTGTTYTLLAADNGKVITFNNAAAITVTVPSGLGAGFNCMAIQKGAGQVTFSASGTTLNNRQSHTKTAGQKAVVSLVADVADNFYLGGDTAA